MFGVGIFPQALKVKDGGDNGGGDPQTHTTDFSEYTVDQPPSDWIATWAGADGDWVVRNNGESFLEFEGFAGRRHALYWNLVPEASDVEILAELEGFEDAAVDEHSDARLLLRADAAPSGDENGYTAGHRWGTTGTSGGVSVSKYSDGDSVALSADGDSSRPLNTRLMVRARAEGTRVKVRVWEKANQEPVDWDYDVDDPNGIPGPGRVGVFSFGHGVVRYYSFSVALSGATAPSI